MDDTVIHATDHQNDVVLTFATVPDAGHWVAGGFDRAKLVVAEKAFRRTGGVHGCCWSLVRGCPRKRGRSRGCPSRCPRWQIVEHLVCTGDLVAGPSLSEKRRGSITSNSWCARDPWSLSWASEYAEELGNKDISPYDLQKNQIENDCGDDICPISVFLSVVVDKSRSFENSYIPENPRTLKPLTSSKNRLRGLKIAQIQAL
ncbi:hypothetical protein LXL04_015162 [Taraxacum kok-saghyz]